MKTKKHKEKFNRTSIWFVFVYIIFSCQNLNEIEKQQYSAAQFEQVGIDHNKGLDFILVSLKDRTFTTTERGKESGKRTLQELLQENQMAAIEFLKLNDPDLTLTDIETISVNLDFITEKALNVKSEQNVWSRSSNANSFSQSIVSEITPYLTSGQTQMISEILNVVENQDHDLNSLINSLYIIENNVYELPAEEQPVVFEALSIARNSAQYWNVNYSIWQDEINEILNDGQNGDLAKVNSVNWGAVAVCDVGCGVLMAVGCVFAGPVGWGFGLKAVAVAATVGSGIAAAII